MTDNVKNNRTDLQELANQLASWRKNWVGRKLFRISAGSDWIRLHLEGDNQPGILLTAIPGCCQVLSTAGGLPPAVYKTMSLIKDHPLYGLLNGYTMTQLGMLPNDRVAALKFTKPGATDLYLLHQLFGPRGNTTVLDKRYRLLWSRQKPPHTLLTQKPPGETWTSGTSETTTGTDSEADTDPALVQLCNVQAQHLENIATAAITRQLRSAEKLVVNLTVDLARAERGEEQREKAETLGTYLHTLKQGVTEVELLSPYTHEALQIKLDPALTPADNMAAYFKLARKAEKGHQIIGERHLEATTKAHQLADHWASLLAVLSAAQGPTNDGLSRLESILSWMEINGDLLPKAASSKKIRAKTGGSETPARPFRRYLIDSRWEVWIGRNNKENDLLTHKASHAQDIWLHAQGVSGSHVILRTGGNPDRVPRQIIEKAAAIAAIHSKAKHSALVPVIFTERRYVRKPRKSLPGVATCIREKSIFVEPGLPAEAVSI